jgi:hypothetical protein
MTKSSPRCAVVRNARSDPTPGIAIDATREWRLTRRNVPAWDFTTELTRVRALLDNMERHDDRDQDRAHASEVEGAGEARVPANKKLTTRVKAKGIGKVVNIKTVKARASQGRSGKGQTRRRAVGTHKGAKQVQ